MPSIQLFTQTNVDDAWIERRQAMEKECASVPDSEVFSGDLEEISQRIAEKYFFDIPEVLGDQLTYDEPVFNRSDDRALIVWHIPIRGDGSLLSCYSRSCPMQPVFNVTVENDVMSFRTNPRRDRISEGKQALDELLKQIAQYLPPVVKSLTDCNGRFARFARSPLERRRSELQANLKASAALAQLGVPLRKRTDEVAQTFVPVKRKIIPIPDSPKSASANPVLEMKAYEDILCTITAMAHGIERSPATFKGMDEEDIRIILLVGLNAVYEGQATGETFNGIGVVDPDFWTT